MWNVSEVAFWNRQILRPGCRWCHRGKRERGAETKLKRCWLRSTWGLSREERTRQGKRHIEVESVQEGARCALNAFLYMAFLKLFLF